MRTEYMVITYGCEQRNQIARVLTDWSERGWQLVDSWRFTSIGVESVAFLLAREQETKPEPERVTCRACGGRGYHHTPPRTGGAPSPAIGR